MSTTTSTSIDSTTREPLRPTGAERRLAWGACAYAVLGLIAGLYYRALTHSRDFTGETVLSLTHTHLLALGMIMLLVVLVLERLFGLSRSRAFRWFEPTYHVGLLVTVGALLVRGTLQVVATNPTSPAFAGIAGLGHILLTVAIVALFASLLRSQGTRGESDPVA